MLMSLRSCFSSSFIPVPEAGVLAFCDTEHQLDGLAAKQNYAPTVVPAPVCTAQAATALKLWTTLLARCATAVVCL